MRTTTLTITIEATADESESRIQEALLADIQEHYSGWYTTTGTHKRIKVTGVKVERADDIERSVLIKFAKPEEMS